MDWKENVALVTGGSSGIGAALVAEIARRGGRVVAAARRLDRLENLAADLARTGARGDSRRVRCDPPRRPRRRCRAGAEGIRKARHGDRERRVRRRRKIRGPLRRRLPEAVRDERLRRPADGVRRPRFSEGVARTSRVRRQRRGIRADPRQLAVRDEQVCRARARGIAAKRARSARDLRHPRRPRIRRLGDLPGGQRREPAPGLEEPGADGFAWTRGERRGRSPPRSFAGAAKSSSPPTGRRSFSSSGTFRPSCALFLHASRGEAEGPRAFSMRSSSPCT